MSHKSLQQSEKRVFGELFCLKQHAEYQTPSQHPFQSESRCMIYIQCQCLVIDWETKKIAVVVADVTAKVAATVLQ